jgi:PIN domain nuclease of toxin-antitoxin system
MTYLLDTHTLIWYAEGDPKLPNRIRKLILDPENSIFISYASIWEMSIKLSLGKLKVMLPISGWEKLLLEEGFQFLSFSFHHFETLSGLPFHHNDPFDRLLISQAISEDIVLITHDSRFSDYNAKLELF